MRTEIIRNPDLAPSKVLEISTQLGRHITEARKRRRLRQADVARMAGVTLPTVRAVESGSLGTSLGAYVGVLWALGLEDGLTNVATPEQDAVGQQHQRAALKRGTSLLRSTRKPLDDDF